MIRVLPLAVLQNNQPMSALIDVKYYFEIQSAP